MKIKGDDGRFKPIPIEYEVDSNGCHICTSHVPNKGGYYILKINGHKYKLHRIKLEEKLGRRIREGYFACHLCDNNLCINPDHLIEGTHLDNMKYKYKDRVIVGTRISDGYSETFSIISDFAKKYNIHRNGISNALSGYSKRCGDWTFVRGE